jgi:hypothetical protein
MGRRMGSFREKKMTRGILLFAFNTPKVDYFKMAVHTAKRAKHFLNLPVSVVTDESTNVKEYDFTFDNVFIQTADKTNTKDSDVWINKGRYQAYDLSPYEETLLIDTDYLINSNTLIKVFDLYDDFMCHNTTSFLMIPNSEQEKVSETSFNTLWATVIAFRKTEKTKMIFNCMKMVQENYEHYINLYNILGLSYRNDFALTIAHRIVNGQSEDITDYIPWNLVHIGKNTTLYNDTTEQLNTTYTAVYDKWNNGKIKKEYCTVTDTDFHLLNKENFMELINE